MAVLFYNHFLSILCFLFSSIAFAIAAPLASQNEASQAFKALQTFYNSSSGLWSTTGWWNSANCLTTIGALAAVDSGVLPTVKRVFLNTYVQAPKYNLQQLKVITPDFNIQTYTGPTSPNNVFVVAATNPKGFLNGYYDDEGWWALGWIQAYDLTKNLQYLDTAVDIFNDMAGGATTPCGGGIWWDKAKTYTNAIANELYLSVASHLANRIPSNKTYITTAQSQWAWFQQTGMINAQNTINDGLDDSCENNAGTVWSYNQGVILGGLVELSKATGNTSLLNTASTIATAAIAKLSDSNSVLHDPCEPNCGADGSQFKGVFMRNLQILQKAKPKDEFVNFIGANAVSIWKYDRDEKNFLSVIWSGAFVAPANASTQSSALDALVAARAFSRLPSDGIASIAS